MNEWIEWRCCHIIIKSYRLNRQKLRFFRLIDDWYITSLEIIAARIYEFIWNNLKQQQSRIIKTLI